MTLNIINLERFDIEKSQGFTMDIKEVLSLVFNGYGEEDKNYKKEVYFLSNFLSALVFFIIHLILQFFKDIGFLVAIAILIILMGLGAIVKYRRSKLEVYSYFNRIMDEIVCYALLCIIVSSLTVFFIYPSLLGVFIASIYGLIMAIEGILFKSKVRKFGGILLIFSTLAMIVYLNYQFLILAIVQVINAFLQLLIPLEKRDTN